MRLIFLRTWFNLDKTGPNISSFTFLHGFLSRTQVCVLPLTFQCGGGASHAPSQGIILVPAAAVLHRGGELRWTSSGLSHISDTWFGIITAE